MSDKHLVLDPDVHERLKSKKRKHGATLREIGNSILRSVLDRRPLSEAIAKKLISQGKITLDDYETAREEVVRELDASARHVEEHLALTERGTFVSGSWEVLVRETGASVPYQVLEGWAIDGDRRPLPLHLHEKSDEHFIVIAGRVLVAFDEGETVLEEGSSLRVPAGRPHAVTPLTASTQMVVVCHPPDPGFLADSEASCET